MGNWLGWFVVSIFCLLGTSLLAQQPAWAITGKSIPELRSESRDPLLPVAPSMIHNRYLQASLPGLHQTGSDRLAGSTRFLSATDSSWFSRQYVDQLAFFCRLEIQLEKVTRFPIKFRLGEVQYTEALEGK